MNLKKTILATMGRDELKDACGALEIEGCDLRSAKSMRDALGTAKRAKPAKLLKHLNEPQVKEVTERMGLNPTGRKSALIEQLLGDGEDVDELTDGSANPVTERAQGALAAAEGAAQYRHLVDAIQRPDAGVQDQFQARKPPRTYRYDSSLDPALSWDEQRERGLGEWLLGLVVRAAQEGEAAVFGEAQEWKGGGVRVASLADAARTLQQISKPFLDWAGKAERHEIRVPTAPLFVHERHSTKAILDGIRHRKARGQTLDLFGDAGMDIRENLEAYEHKGPWQNRMILGDSLSVMNSLLEFEGMAGQVQMIYIDPPYGVKFGSNFQPFVRKRDVKHGGDEDMTREPEMVKAYRDTWEMGLHSYLTYLRDRLIVAKELLHESGSVFLQISDENLHHVREVADEIFGAENLCGIIPFKKTSGQASTLIAGVCDFLIWYGRNKSRAKYRQLYSMLGEDVSDDSYDCIELADGGWRRLTAAERRGDEQMPTGRRFRTANLTSQGWSEEGSKPYKFEGKTYAPSKNTHWKPGSKGLPALENAGRLVGVGNTLAYRRFIDDFPVVALNNLWIDTVESTFVAKKLYTVQTSAKVIQRCMLMCTDPGDLVLDPTCGSATTAYVAEQWGRRWITIDTSRVPIALARQRLLTATFPYFELKSPQSGPVGGFAYQRKQNRKGEEIGGLVRHVTLKSVANSEPPAMEVLVDRPEEVVGITRVSGPFVVEATIAPVQPVNTADDAEAASGDIATHIQRMTEVLRQAKTLHLPGNRELTLAGVRRTVDTEYLHAEAKEGDKRVAITFGPPDGAVSAALVFESAREAYFLKFDRLFFFGFAIEPSARAMIEDDKKLRIPSAYVAVTPDVTMSDLLKTTRASEIFSVTGLPDVAVRRTKKKGPEGQALHEVELKGLDLFDPESMDTESIHGENVPCWMLDTDYDGMSFYATQVFFPKTSAWDNLQRSMRATFDESVWTHLAGTVSEPFAVGDRRRIAVKVIDERGNELMRVLDVAG